jgi:hypothetical protein
MTGKDRRSEDVVFEVLFKTPGIEKIGEGEDPEKFRPPAEAVGMCLKWLTAHGVTCYDTGFSIACNGPRTLLEELFDTAIERGEDAPGQAPWRFAGAPKVPEELSTYIEEIVITVQPELLT